MKNGALPSTGGARLVIFLKPIAAELKIFDVILSHVRKGADVMDRM